MYANELAEIRKLIKLLSQTQIAIERIILRLETIKELSTIMIDLKPALTSLKNVTCSLVNVMPNIASELDKVNQSIQETLTVTKVTSEPSILPADLKTPGGQKIIKEVHAALEQKLTQQLPEPPPIEHLVESTQPKQEIREMVALVAGCPESAESQQNETSETYLSFKDMQMQSISFRIQPPKNVEDTLLAYIKQCNGRLDVTECALKLKIPPKEVKKTLENLGAKGKIIMET